MKARSIGVDRYLGRRELGCARQFGRRNPVRLISSTSEGIRARAKQLLAN
jgi:hypothetical protein